MNYNIVQIFPVPILSNERFGRLHSFAKIFVLFVRRSVYGHTFWTENMNVSTLFYVPEVGQ